MQPEAAKRHLMTIHKITASEMETAHVAKALAPFCKIGDVLCLHGDLGMGKSVFARALIRTLLKQDDLDVPSPTFTLVQTYESPLFPIWHFDLYRLQDPEDVIELGWDEAMAMALSIVEWPEKLGHFLPRNRMDIQFEQYDPSRRAINFTPHGTFQGRAFL
jgi:tRNA threonylcarbamoyladenosine biosynthesis protein TsaE